MISSKPDAVWAEAERWLRAGADGALSVDKVIETHCAVVILAGERAFKLKKPVNLGYLDFSTAAKRHWALERELAFNRPMAADVYRAVHTVTREAGGRLALNGAGAAVEHVLEMRRFDEASVMSNNPQVVQGSVAEGLGRAVADVHAAAEPRPMGGGTGALGYTITSNGEHLRSLAELLTPQAVEQLIGATDAAFAAQAALLNKRQALGLGRRCHGDLHLGNIFMENDRPVLFDCIEFNDRLSDIDVQYDLAFLLMDLMFRGNGDGAARVLSGYLDQAARSLGDTVFEGLACLPLMLSVRATVRAHVSAQMGQGDLSRAYLEAAMAHLQPKPPRLLAVGGLSGSGKSTMARRLAPKCGGVILRSDEIRKRLWGCAPLQALPREAYHPDQSARVYGQMLHEALLTLKAGRSVVLDGVFLRGSERDAVRALAKRVGAEFEGLWLEASPTVLSARIRARSHDASDADQSVLAAQLSQDPGDIDWYRSSDKPLFSET